MKKLIVYAVFALTPASGFAQTNPAMEQLKMESPEGAQSAAPEAVQPGRSVDFEADNFKFNSGPVVCTGNDAGYEEHFGGHNGKDEIEACRSCLGVHGECNYECGTSKYVCAAQSRDPFNNHPGAHNGYPGNQPGWHNGFPGGHNGFPGNSHGGFPGNNPGMHNGFPGGHNGFPGKAPGWHNGFPGNNYGRVFYGAPSADRWVAEENALRKCRNYSGNPVFCRVTACDLRSSILKSGKCVR